MADDGRLSDREHFIMARISEDGRVTQRDLSGGLGVSVSTVNVLLAKMVREGLVKMSQVSKRQVLYMLTPAGVAEKAKKTMGYLKGHYRAFYEAKERMKVVVRGFCKAYDHVFLLIPQDEMGEMLAIALDELKGEVLSSDPSDGLTADGAVGASTNLSISDSSPNSSSDGISISSCFSTLRREDLSEDGLSFLDERDDGRLALVHMEEDDLGIVEPIKGPNLELFNLLDHL